MLNWPPYYNILWNGLELGWNCTKDIQADQFGSFARPRISQKWPKGANIFPKQTENNPLARQIGSYGLCWCGKKIPKCSAGLPTVVFQSCFIPSNPK